MTILNEDYTAAVLAGTPIFCVNRVYKKQPAMNIIKEYYRFRFLNDYGASVVEFADTYFSGGCRYELAVLKYDGEQYSITYETKITSDVERGDAMDMHRLLCDIENLK